MHRGASPNETGKTREWEEGRRAGPRKGGVLGRETPAGRANARYERKGAREVQGEQGRSGKSREMTEKRQRHKETTERMGEGEEAEDEDQGAA